MHAHKEREREREGGGGGGERESKFHTKDKRTTGFCLQCSAVSHKEKANADRPLFVVPVCIFICHKSFFSVIA